MKIPKPTDVLGYQIELLDKIEKLEQQNAAMLDCLLYLDTAIDPQSRKYDEYGYCKIHQEILQDFQGRVENALAEGV